MFTKSTGGFSGRARVHLHSSKAEEAPKKGEEKMAFFFTKEQEQRLLKLHLPLSLFFSFLFFCVKCVMLHQGISVL